MIAEHCWRLLTANPVRAVDDRLVLWLASESFSCGQELSGAEGAARAEPSLLELCRVASEEDEVNGQEFVRNLFSWKFLNKIFLDDSWLLLGIPDYKTARHADIRPWNGFAGETFFVWVSNCQEWPAISMKYYFYNFRKRNIAGWLLDIADDCWPQNSPLCGIW